VIKDNVIQQVCYAHRWPAAHSIHWSRFHSAKAAWQTSPRSHGSQHGICDSYSQIRRSAAVQLVLAGLSWAPDAKNWLVRKDTDAGKDWRQEEKRMTENEMVGWHHDSMEWVWASCRSGWWTGRPAVLSPWGHRVRHDWATELKSGSAGLQALVGIESIPQVLF